MNGSLRVEIVAPEQLTKDHDALWHGLLDTDVEVRSPFLTPEFVRLVGRGCNDVAVAVITRGKTPVGFFPFQWKTETIAGPVGGRMSDLQAAVVPRSLEWSVEELLADCDLECWDFDHLLSSQRPWRSHHYAIEPSPYLDLSQGFTAYCESRRRAGSDKIRQILRKRRTLDREHGPLRFEPYVVDEGILDRLLRWKSEQFLRTGQPDLFAERWPRRLLADLFNERSDRLSAMMAVLYAGPRAVAIDLGMRSGGTFHSWFVAYDPDVARFSPGHVLTITIAEHCESLGIDRFELGKGPEEYKRSLASASFGVAEGSADLRPVSSRVRRGWDGTRRWVRTGPFGPHARKAARFVRTLSRSLASL